MGETIFVVDVSWSMSEAALRSAADYVKGFRDPGDLTYLLEFVVGRDKLVRADGFQDDPLGEIARSDLRRSGTASRLPEGLPPVQTKVLLTDGRVPESLMRDFDKIVYVP